MSKVNFSDEFKRDGFFAGEGVPYTYTAGDCGVELIEFLRHRAFGHDLQLGAQGRRPRQRSRDCVG